MKDTQLIEHVLRLDVGLQAAGARLQARSDDEALHDLRVGVRRLRSLLRPLRNLSDINTLEAAAAALGHLSTPLRDTEVLVQELDARALPELAEPRRRQLQAGCAALLASAEWRHLRNELDAWPESVRQARRNGDLDHLDRRIRKRLTRQKRLLAEGLRDPQHDPHRLRILIKRVRYAAEVYPEQSDLPAKVPERLKEAQSALGDWHDCTQWLHRAEQETDLQLLCEPWRQALAAAEQRSAEALKPLCKQFS